jgi:serine/threonine protein phosphatase PrpC
MPEKIGTAGPPPGIRGQDIRVKQERLSLRRGEILILLSDGVDGEGVRRRAVTEAAAPLGELAARLLETGAEETADDSSVAVVRLQGWGMLT